MEKNHVQVSLKAVFDFNSWVYMDKISKKGMDQHMKKLMQRAGILFLIFIAAIVVYFAGARKSVKQEDTVYSSMDEPGLPVVYTEFQGEEINGLHGYLQDMGNRTARDSISILPADRSLTMRIHEYGNTITGISYEIRTLSMERLIERTQIQDWTSDRGVTSVSLPIQNLIAKDEAYLLILNVKTAEKQIQYYTRIMWTGQPGPADMLQLAREFTTKSLNYDQARDLVSYLETNPGEDNSSLGHVTIRASFDHLTWDGLKTELVGEPQIILQEFDGIMGQIQVRYQVRLTDSAGRESLVHAEDNFTMKWNEQRIYLMNYERNADHIFNGSADLFSGKRILLGISEGTDLHTVKSPDSRYIFFKVNGNLWRYDQKEQRIMCIFTFLDKEGEDVRSAYDRHSVQILQATDDGSADFLVYGYMNRGPYEGRTGVVFYHYNNAGSMVEEKFFIPAAEDFEKMKQDVEKLSYVSPEGMVYLMLGGNVFGVDLSSNESILVAQGLTEGTFAVSNDGSRMAWQEGEDSAWPEKIHVMDFNTSQKQEISASEGECVRVLGFVGSDLIYGFARQDDVWKVNGRVQGLPMYAMYIVDSEMNIESEYKKDGIYISDVVTEDGRIHLKRLVKQGEEQYIYQDEDTIVCNQKVEDDPLEGIGWYASQEMGRLYFVQMDSDLKDASVKMDKPTAFSYENTSTLELAGKTSLGEDGQVIFYAYGGGHFLGASRQFSEAVNLAYDKMGFVTDENQHLVWDRINRQPVRNLKDPTGQAADMMGHMDGFNGSTLFDDGIMVIDASGCMLNQVLYFIDKGIPVIAYREDGSYVLLSGYDTYNVTIYDPGVQDTTKMGLGDAASYFESQHNSFLCGLKVE